MIQAIINHLGQDLTALPKEASHGLAQIIEGVPSVYTGDGNYRPVTDDAAGGFSYWRLSGTVTSSPYSDIGCTNAQRVSVPLMFVAFVPRELCTDPDSEAWRLQAVITARVTKLGKRIRGVFRSAVTSTQSGADMIRTSEIRGYAVPSHLVVLHVKLTVVLHGDTSCMDLCGPVEVPCTPTDCPGACDVIQALQWTEVEGCLTDEQKEDAIESLCGPCPPCEDGVVKLNGTPVGDVPSGGELDVPVTRQGTNTPVGAWNSGAGRYEIAPGAAQLRDTQNIVNIGSPVAIPAEETVNIPLPQTLIQYTDASGGSGRTDPYNTDPEGANIRPDVTVERREYLINSTGTGAYVDLTHLLPGGAIREIIIADTNGDPITPDDVDISDPRSIVVTIDTGGAPTELVFTLAPLDEFSLGDDPDGWTIASGCDIEYTTITDDGASGTWEYSINGGSWTPLGSSLDLTGMAGDVIKVRRSVSTGAGWLKLEP